MKTKRANDIFDAMVFPASFRIPHWGYRKESFMNFFSKSLVLTVAFATSASFAKGAALDTQQSHVKWVGKKVTGQHNGIITIKSGEMELDGNNLKGGKVEIDMNSIACEDIKDTETNAKLIGHLKSDDFFGVEKHPTSTLVIKSVKPAAKGAKDATHEITGDLTIKGTTHPVTFPATVEVKSGKVHATGKVEIDRTKYNVRYGSGKFFQNLGDKTIYDNFELTFDVKS